MCQQSLLSIAGPSGFTTRPINSSPTGTCMIRPVRRTSSPSLISVNNNTEVELVTKNGDYVLGSDGNPIRFASTGIDGIQIEEDGTIMVTRGQQTENIGEISIVSIDNPRILEADGDNNFRLPNEDESGLGYADVVGAVNTGGKLLQSGALEMSNVDI